MHLLGTSPFLMSQKKMSCKLLSQMFEPIISENFQGRMIRLLPEIGGLQRNKVETGTLSN